jgi:hypothetical protein
MAAQHRDPKWHDRWLGQHGVWYSTGGVYWKVLEHQETRDESHRNQYRRDQLHHDNNGLDGFAFNPGCTVTACSANGNTGIGFFAATMGVLTGCSSTNNGSLGFDARAGSTVVNCSARNNVGDGFNLGDGVSLINCSSYGSDARG